MSEAGRLVSEATAAKMAVYTLQAHYIRRINLRSRETQHFPRTFP